jgi:Tfp pilus assembly protein PilF
MHRTTCRLTILIGLTSLIAVYNTRADAGTLRQEAINYRVQGYEQQRRGDLAGALTSYEKAVALDPEYATPHNDMGVIFEQQGRLEDAERAYKTALERNPNHLEAHANLAMLYEREGNKESAIFHWIKRYQLGDPYDPWTARAEERLVGLGVLKTHPGLKGMLYTRRRVVDEALQDQAKSLDEFHAVTEEHGDWP